MTERGPSLDSERRGDFSDYAIHEAVREFRQVFPMVVTGVLFVAATALPAVSRVLGFGLREAVLSVGVFVVGMVAATAAYHLAGARSSWYRALEFAESLTTTWAVMVLIFASKSAVSFIWLFHFIHLLMLAACGLSPRNGFAAVVGPLGLALAFELAGDAASSLLSFLAGLLGLIVYAALGRVHTDLEQSRRREAGLRLALAELRVNEERHRISRDLHDSVATDLTALIWKARELARVTSTSDVARELATFERRLTRTLGDLRDVVTALRASHSSFPDAVRALEERCRELAGELSFDFSQRGELAQSEVERFCDEVFPIACELMKNAVVHSGGRAVVLTLGVDDRELSLTVSDDGAGLPEGRMEQSRGGLHNVQGRVRNLAGEFVVTSGDKGTTLAVILPRPLRARSRDDSGADALPPSGIKRAASSPSHEHGSISPSRTKDEAR
jgi:signal transduction histidine kinase